LRHVASSGWPPRTCPEAACSLRAPARDSRRPSSGRLAFGSFCCQATPSNTTSDFGSGGPSQRRACVCPCSSRTASIARVLALGNRRVEWARTHRNPQRFSQVGSQSFPSLPPRWCSTSGKPPGSYVSVVPSLGDIFRATLFANGSVLWTVHPSAGLRAAVVTATIALWPGCFVQRSSSGRCLHRASSRLPGRLGCLRQVWRVQC
jgi:hypothetical protein